MSAMSRHRGWPARGLRAILAAIVITGAVIASVWWAAQPRIPDEFYRMATPLATKAGTIYTSHRGPFDRGMPEGSRAWRILYATTRLDGTPATASAIVLISGKPHTGPRPALAWAHGTTGIAPGCAPSVMGKPVANVPAVKGLLREGWVYVATDYAGLGTGGGHGYLIGDDAARSVLDAVRAARQLPELAIDNRVVVWGHRRAATPPCRRVCVRRPMRRM